MPDAPAVLRRMFDEIINQGRLDVVDELFADDFVDHGPMGDIQGRAAFKELVAQWRTAVPDVHCQVENVVADGDLAGWVVRTTGTHTGEGLGFPATGKSFETVSANIGRFHGELAAKHWSKTGNAPDAPAGRVAAGPGRALTPICARPVTCVHRAPPSDALIADPELDLNRRNADALLGFGGSVMATPRHGPARSVPHRGSLGASG